MSLFGKPIFSWLIFSPIYLLIPSYNCLDFYYLFKLFSRGLFEHILVMHCSFNSKFKMFASFFRADNKPRFFSDFLSFLLIRNYIHYRKSLHSSLQWRIQPLFYSNFIRKTVKNNGKITWRKKAKTAVKHFFKCVRQKHARQRHKFRFVCNEMFAILFYLRTSFLVF